MGWDEPEYIHNGLVSIPDTNLKTSNIRESISKNEFSGWDDCRLATLKALARRGYQSKTFLKYWENAGIKEELIYQHNASFEGRADLMMF